MKEYSGNPSARRLVSAAAKQMRSRAKREQRARKAPDIRSHIGAR